jgi:hypothetical protein
MRSGIAGAVVPLTSPPCSGRQTTGLPNGPTLVRPDEPLAYVGALIVAAYGRPGATIWGKMRSHMTESSSVVSHDRAVARSPRDVDEEVKARS